MSINVNRVLVCVVLAAIVAIVLPATGFAQIVAPGPDGGIWSGDTNPNGVTPVPIVWYNPDDFTLRLNGFGLNAVSDTSDGTLIGGDDVGLISMVVVAPETTDIGLTGFTSGILWNGQFFNGKMQVFGTTTPGNAYLLPSEDQVLFTWDTPLTEEDFGGVLGSGMGAPMGVELGINTEDGQPGGTIFGAVQWGVIIPEPAGLCLIATALFGMVGFVRRRK